MSEFTVKELEEKLEKDLFTEDDEEDGYEDGWYRIEELDNSFRRSYGKDKNLPDDTIELEGFGTLEFVESFGGEGKGDERWVVFKIDDRMFKKSGYYASYDGTTWDGALEEVKPVQVEVTQYEAVVKE